MDLGVCLMKSVDSEELFVCLFGHEGITKPIACIPLYRWEKFVDQIEKMKEAAN